MELSEQDRALEAVTRLVASIIATHQGEEVVTDAQGNFLSYRIDGVGVQWIGPLIPLDSTRQDTQQAIHVFVQVEVPPEDNQAI